MESDDSPAIRANWQGTTADGKAVVIKLTMEPTRENRALAATIDPGMEVSIVALQGYLPIREEHSGERQLTLPTGMAYVEDLPCILLGNYSELVGAILTSVRDVRKGGSRILEAGQKLCVATADAREIASKDGIVIDRRAWGALRFNPGDNPEDNRGETEPPAPAPENGANEVLIPVLCEDGSLASEFVVGAQVRCGEAGIVIERGGKQVRLLEPSEEGTYAQGMDGMDEDGKLTWGMYLSRGDGREGVRVPRESFGLLSVVVPAEVIR